MVNVRNRRSNTDTVAVKPIEGTTYSEIIQSMKREVDTGEVKIDGITKSQQGEIILRVKGGNQASRDNFREKLKSKMKDNADVVNRKQIIMLVDLDPTVNEDEIGKVLNEELGVKFEEEETNIRIIDEGNKAGKKYAVLTTSKSIRCRRVEHECKSCREELLVGCYNCGGSDHKLKECRNIPRCYLCKEEGYRTETLACPI